MNKNLRNIAFVVFLGVVVLTFLVTNDFQSIVASFHQLSIIDFLYLSSIMIAFYLLNSFSLYLLTRIYNKNYSFMNAVHNSMIGIFFNGITPMASGGQFYQVYYFKKQNVKIEDATSILLVQFITYQIVLVLYTSIIMVVQFQKLSQMYNAFFYSCLFGFIVNIGVVVCLLIGATSKKTQRIIIEGVFSIAHFFRLSQLDDYKDSIYVKLDEFRSSFEFMKNHKRVFVKVLIVHFLRLTLLYSIPYMCMKVLHVHVNDSIFYFIALTAFVHMIADVVPLPGASGGSEGTFYYLFTGILKNNVTGVLLLWRFFTYYFGLIAGFCFLLVKLKKDIKRT